MCTGHDSPIDRDSLVQGDPPDHHWGCKAHRGSLRQAPSNEPGCAGFLRPAKFPPASAANKKKEFGI